jgi:hypothetical protein
MVNGTFGRVWLYEWFMRIAGADYTFWTLGIQRMLSTPVLTADAYPEQGGARPIVIGLGAVEAFRPYPMSPVESWQPLQLELNDHRAAKVVITTIQRLYAGSTRCCGYPPASGIRRASKPT